MVASNVQLSEALAYSANGTKPKTHSTRYRLRFQFWLDATKDIEFYLAEQVAVLKQQRQFAPTIRQALELIISLRHERVDVLERLFPWIRTHYEAAGQGDLLARIERLEAQLQQQPAPQPVLKPVAAPEPDDDLASALSMKKAESDGLASANNFLDSALSLQL